MPVFDFTNSPKDTGDPECTYKIFYSSQKEASPEHPMLVLDNREGKLIHHSSGIFLNPIKRTAFEFKGEEGGTSGNYSYLFCAGYKETRRILCHREGSLKED